MYLTWILSLIAFCWTCKHHVSCAAEITVDSRQMKTAGFQGLVAQVVPVTSETTAEVYECVHGADPAADANYTWYRHDSASLPEGTKAEGNRLYFMHSSSELNGLYGCIVINEKGTASAFYYRKIQDCLLHRILKHVLSVWMLMMQTLSLTW